MSDLMKPRFKVIADYPNSIVSVGSIIEPDEESVRIKSPNGAVSVQSYYLFRDMHKYPHLFAPLPWYAERELSEMPKYVKFTEDFMDRFKSGDVYKTCPYWGDSEKAVENVCYFMDAEGKCGVPMWNDRILPATESEYLTYTSHTKNDKG